MTENYEIYYNDGGHSGPYGNFISAHHAAVRHLNGCKSTTAVEIRSYNSPVIGGFKARSAESFYVSRKDDKLHLSVGI